MGDILEVEMSVYVTIKRLHLRSRHRWSRSACQAAIMKEKTPWLERGARTAGTARTSLGNQISQ